jgi:hypothetical protein
MVTKRIYETFKVWSSFKGYNNIKNHDSWITIPLVLLKNFYWNMLTTIGRCTPSLLQRLNLRNFKVKKHLSNSTLPKTRMLSISSSLRYSSRLWHNILELDIVHHNRVKGLRSRGSYITTTTWFFIVILKKPCWM